jgi:Arc/MetJ family transcription regulator
MSRTNIDLDEEACLAVMRRYLIRTKWEAVNFAVRTLRAEMLELDEARRMRGTGWEGDHEEMRLLRGE